jgi:hypothetical protein
MFAKPTVFILGAGASWHYGYPTGEELVRKVIQKATYLQRYLEFSEQTLNPITPNFLADTAKSEKTTKQKWVAAMRDCAALMAGLQQVNPLVIDYYLGWNPKLQWIGRALIAWVIMECEHLQEQNRANINRKEALLNSPLEAERVKSRTVDLKKYKDDWCRFVIHQLAISCKTSSDILKNDVRFVTFNYDISLERALGHGLAHIELFQREDIETFLTNNRIVHVYGKVRENPFERPASLNWQEQGRDPKDMGHGQLQHLHDYKNFLDHIYAASQGIHVIDPDDKETDKNVIELAASAIESAKYVYILGYGFDQNNSARLRLQKALRTNPLREHSVFFTNFGNISRINKRASKLFFDDPSHFSTSGSQVETVRNIYYCEKSHRDVYEALELDFDLPTP